MGKYIKDYEGLRTFLRYISYGCYHKRYLAQLLGESERSYEENWARVRFFLPEERLHCTREGHREIHTLAGDAYENADNFLALTYEMKGITPRRAFYLLLSLAALRYGPQDEQTLLIALELAGKEASRSTLHRTLGELAALGLAVRKRQGGRDYYALPESPLADLTPTEKRTLLSALTLARAVRLPAMPGYFLAATLRHSEPALTPPPARFQLKHTPLARLLDDEAINVTLACLRERRTLLASYRGQKIAVQPLALVRDDWRGQVYLRCLRTGKRSARKAHRPQLLRLDFLKDVRPGDRQKEVPAVREAERHPLLLAFSPADTQDARRLAYRVRKHFPDAELEAADHGFTARLMVHDELALLPWLRSFFPAVRVLTGSAALTQRLKNDLKEGLKSYGNPLP